MADETRKSQAKSVSDRLAALVSGQNHEAAGQKKREVDQWIKALAAAETAAKAEANSKLRLFQINYRIKEVADQKKGAASQRREHLVAILGSLKSSERHASTSTWIVRLHIEKAEAILALLKGPVADSDYLAVAQISSNRAKFGDADLE